MGNEYDSTFNKVGIAAGTLFMLMIIGFFVFVYFDATMTKGHATATEPAEHAQVEEHAATDDHAADTAHAKEDTDHSSEKH